VTARTPRRRDQGSASLELVILAPGLLLLLAVLLQGAWWYMARAAAHAAAAEGARAARAYQAEPEAGPDAALRFAREVADGQLLNPAADGSGSDATNVVITVEGTAPSFLPGFSPRVSQTVRAPRERFVPDIPAGAP
jgi:Flp pilus assembly protein TadG